MDPPHDPSASDEEPEEEEVVIIEDSLGDQEEPSSSGSAAQHKPFDLSGVPQGLGTYADESLNQSTILDELVGNIQYDDPSKERFKNTSNQRLKLSYLEKMCEEERGTGVNILATRHTIKIDSKYCIPFGTERLHFDTKESMIDYHLTVANCIGFSTLLPNVESAHRFAFDLNLKTPHISFKGKHAMLGFDPTGCMLKIGTCNNEDVFLAMVPNTFFRGTIEPSPLRRSTASSMMSARHYRQVVMMFAHFLAEVPTRAYYNLVPVYRLDLNAPKPDFAKITNIMGETAIRLNFEDVKSLDDLIVDGYARWVAEAPHQWKVDKFLTTRSPIIVTSRYGQNARIAIPGNEDAEAEAWQTERDYSKLAFFTFAIATSLKCTEIADWTIIPNDDIIEQYGEDGIFDSADLNSRLPVTLDDDYPLVDENGQEVRIYRANGNRINRRLAVVDLSAPPCGVLVNLKTIQALFKPSREPPQDEARSVTSEDLAIAEEQEEHHIHIDAYPLAFLGSFGNIQANGVPPCFYPKITEINQSTRRNLPPPRRRRASLSSEEEEEEEDEYEEEDRVPSRQTVVKPISCQFYNYVSHRMATRAGQLDSQHGTVTAAISGAYAETEKNKRTATSKQQYCTLGLPSDRFHEKMTSNVDKIPTCCRAELVYTVDVRALDDPSGRSIFNDIIRPLAATWRDKKIRDVIKEHLKVFTPGVFPAMFHWVAYPINALIKSLFDFEMQKMVRATRGSRPSPFRVELLASLERTLAFCHTGNVAVLATSLMGPLGLSRSMVTDGYPYLDATIFPYESIHYAMTHGFEILPQKWPMKGLYPAVASRRTQVLTYSLEHFMTYEATFRIDHASRVPSRRVYPSGYSESRKKTLDMCIIAFDAFFEDTKQLVAQGVRSDIARRKADASSEEEFALIADWSHLREGHLTAWLKLSSPLAYTDDTGNDSYKHLLGAVSPDESAVIHGLPNWHEASTNRSDMADRLFSMSTPEKPTDPRAPVLRTGSFLPVLKVVHRALADMVEPRDKVKQIKVVKRAFVLSLETFKVGFVPAAKLRTGTSGRPYTKPLFNSWGHLGLPDASTVAVEENLGPRPNLDPATVALNNAVATDAYSGWTAADLDLTSMKNILAKLNLPTDLHPPDSPAAYVTDTYNWVRTNYNGTKTFHHLALLVAIVMSNSLLPHLHCPKENVKQLFVDATPEEVRKIYNELEWITKRGGGQKDRKIFICMFVTYMIAMYEKESPLREHMATSPRKGEGDKWRDKHRVKGVTYQSLIRVGMMWGRGTGAFEKGMFNKDWGLHSAEQYEWMYKSLRTKLKQPDFGPYDVLNLLIGEKNARVFSRRDRLNLATRPPTRSQ